MNLGFAMRFAAVFALMPLSAAQALPPTNASVERSGREQLTLRWSSSDPVDVLVADQAATPIKSAKEIIRADNDGGEVISSPSQQRRYFYLRNARTGEVTKVAERVLPLEQGSNFRDLGGYPAADGKHVRWGMIFRSGASPMLTATDLKQIGALNLQDLIDLRSDEERVLAPSRIDGIPYSAIGYSMGAMGFSGGMEAGYRAFPKFLAPHLRLVFAKLLRGEQPLIYNCSAGQDRTGFVSAMILSSLGATRATIIEDYHLSTRYRQPQNEMARIDPAIASTNPVAAMFAKYQSDPRYNIPQPLKTAEGKAYLDFALEEIEQTWGSVDKYLQIEIGIGPKERDRLRALYTE